MKNFKSVQLIVAIILLTCSSCGHYLDEIEQDIVIDSDISGIEEVQNIVDLENNIYQGYYSAGSMGFQGEVVNLSGKYFNSIGGNNKPLVIIAHADGLNGMESYDNLATDLASQGYFVACVDRTGIDSNNENTVNAFNTLLQLHLLALYDQFSGITLSSNSLPIKDPSVPTIIGNNVMLIGHSAGGRSVFYRGKEAINHFIGLSLKSIVGIAPTLRKVEGESPDLTNVPHFIIQGNSDTDNVIASYNSDAAQVHYELNEINSKVGIFEQYTISGNAERAYILIPGTHGIHSSLNTKNIILAIANAFLNFDRIDFDNLIRNQITTPSTYNVLYWNGQDDLYYNGISNGIISPGMKYVTKISYGLDLKELHSQELLGNTNDTKTLHWSHVLKIRKQRNTKGFGFNTLKFLLSEYQNYNANKFVRFQAGQLYDFSNQTYSTEGIDPKIRLIYTGIGGDAVSNWMNMSDLTCGKLISAQFFTCDRNVMQTYVIALSEFIPPVDGAQIKGIEFDFSNSIGSKTVVMDNLAFMN